ncbi:hypothetical protein BGZ47_002525, partial [Haplosporangium gracile]
MASIGTSTDASIDASTGAPINALLGKVFEDLGKILKNAGTAFDAAVEITGSLAMDTV